MPDATGRRALTYYGSLGFSLPPLLPPPISALTFLLILPFGQVSVCHVICERRRSGSGGPGRGGRGGRGRAGAAERFLFSYLPPSHAGGRGREGGLSECGRCVMGNNIPPQKVVCTNTTLSPRVSRSAPHSTPRNIPIRHSHRLFLASQLQRYARYLQYVAAYITRIMDHVSHPGKNEGNAA